MNFDCICTKMTTPGGHRAVYTVRWTNGQETLESGTSLKRYAPQLLIEFEREQNAPCHSAPSLDLLLRAASHLHRIETLQT